MKMKMGRGTDIATQTNSFGFLEESGGELASWA
jgi:hypothetical protein